VKGQVRSDQGPGWAAGGGAGVMLHLGHRDERGVRITQHHHAEGVADEQQRHAAFVEQPGHGIIIRGERGDFLTARLHGADGGGGDFICVHFAKLASNSSRWRWRCRLCRRRCRRRDWKGWRLPAAKRPAAMASVKVAMTVSPAPETSKTSCATVGNVKRLLAALTEQHAEFAERDEQQSGGEIVQQPSGGANIRFLSLSGFAVAGFVRKFASSKASLRFGVMSESPAQVQMMHRLGVDAQPDASFPAERAFKFVQQGCVTTPLP
jgi:hypothetical protein